MKTKVKTEKFNWKQLRETATNDGKLPLAIWGEKRGGRRELLDSGLYDTYDELMEALSTFASCFYCFDTIFYCYIDENGKFRSVTIS
jgi:hypothetical protein